MAAAAADLFGIRNLRTLREGSGKEKGSSGWIHPEGASEVLAGRKLVFLFDGLVCGKYVRNFLCVPLDACSLLLFCVRGFL